MPGALSSIISLVKGRRGNSSNGIVGVINLGGAKGTYQATAWGFTRVADSVWGNPFGKRCVTLRETNYSRADWTCYKPGTTEKVASPLQQVLDHPNAVLNPSGGAMSGTQMQRLILNNKLLCGRSVWLRLRGANGLGKDGKTTGLRYLPAQRVTVVGSVDDELLGFVYRDRNGGRLVLLPEDVIYLHYPHPDRIFDGYPPALTAGLPAETDNLAQRFNYDLLANDGAVPGVVIVKGLTGQQFKEAKALWEAGENPGKTRFLGGDTAQYIKTGQTNQELTYSELRHDAKQDQAHAFDVPLVIAEPTDATFANMDAAMRLLIQQTVAFDWAIDADEMTSQLGVEFGVDVGFDTTHIAEMQEALDAKVDRGIKVVLAQAQSVNWLNKELGYDPVPWGDIPLQPVTPLKAAAPALAGGEPDGEEDDTPTAPSAKKATAAVETGDPLELLAAELAELRNLEMPQPPALQAARVRATADAPKLLRRIEVFEARVQRKMATYFARQGKVVAARLEHFAGKSPKAALGRVFTADDEAVPAKQLLDRKRWDEELQAETAAVLADIIDSFGTEAGEALGGDAFAVSADAVKAWILQRSTDVANLVNDTTEAEVRQLLADELDKGSSIADMVTAIRGYFTGDDSRAASRAETFARTEVIGASNYATVAAARQSGVAVGKEWMATVDNTTDEECAALDGAQVGLDDEFDGGVDAPPLHPNCRCTVAILTDDGTVVDEE